MSDNVDMEGQIRLLKAEAVRKDSLIKFQSETVDLGRTIIQCLDESYGFDAEMWDSVIHRTCNSLGVDYEYVVRFLVDSCGVDDDLFVHTFDVTVSMPMVITVRVEARNEDDARDKVYDVVNDYWPRDLIDSFDFDLDTSSVDVEYVEAV